jgi:hypothetical protein
MDIDVNILIGINERPSIEELFGRRFYRLWTVNALIVGGARPQVFRWRLSSWRDT